MTARVTVQRSMSEPENIASSRPLRVIGEIVAAVRRSLKLQLSIVLATALGITVGLAPWTAIEMQKAQLLKVSQAHMSALQELLKTVVTASMLAREPESVQSVIEALASHEDVEAVRIIDMQNVIRFSSHPDERGKRIPTAELSRQIEVTGAMAALSDKAKSHSLTEAMFNRPACFSCHPPERKVLGILQVSLSLEPIRRQLADLKGLAVVATLIALTVIIGSVWLVHTFLVDRPLQELVGVMRRATRGELSARAATTRANELGQVAHHFNDMLSKLEAAQQELEEYHQQQLARADRLATIGEMAATLAHEIRNPLTGLAGVLSTLSRCVPLDDPRRESVREAWQLIQRMDKTIEDVVQYAHPAAPEVREVDLTDVIERSLSLVRPEAARAGVDITAKMNADWRPVATVDPQQIQQVLVNLLLNAVQASAAGGEITLQASTSGTGSGAHVRIEIEDKGKGMTGEELAQAFDPFFTSKLRGTGLGLCIAKRIIEQHRGQISLHSAPGLGTRVELQLPLYPERPDPHPEQPWVS